MCRREQPGVGNLPHTLGIGTPTDRMTSRKVMSQSEEGEKDWRQDASIPLRFPAWAIETKQNSQQMKRDWEYGRYHAMKQNHKEPRKLILLDVAMVSC